MYGGGFRSPYGQQPQQQYGQQYGQQLQHQQLQQQQPQQQQQHIVKKSPNFIPTNGIYKQFLSAFSFRLYFYFVGIVNEEAREVEKELKDEKPEGNNNNGKQQPINQERRWYYEALNRVNEMLSEVSRDKSAKKDFYKDLKSRMELDSLDNCYATAVRYIASSMYEFERDYLIIDSIMEIE